MKSLFVISGFVLISCNLNSGNEKEKGNGQDNAAYVDSLSGFKGDPRANPGVNHSKVDTIYPVDHDTILSLSYNAISCSCAQWSDTRLGSDTGYKQHFYLERESENLVDADTIWDGATLPLKIQVKGRFISESGYPAGFHAKRLSGAAPVFRYNSIKVLQSGDKK